MTPREIVQGLLESLTDMEDGRPVVSYELLHAARDYLASPDTPLALPEPELGEGGAPGSPQSDGVKAETPLPEVFAHVVRPDGSIDPELVARELHDYEMLLDFVPKVYQHVTGGRVSKPNTRPEAVIAEHDDFMNRLCAEAVAEAREEDRQGVTAPTPDPIREAAEEMVRLLSTEAFTSNHPGRYEEMVSDAEHYLRSALPSVSSLLGELVTMRGALEELDRCCQVVTWRNDDATHTYSGPYCSDRPPWPRVKAALAPGSGRLAGEVLRAAVEDARTEGSSLRLISAVSALLDAHPELGREVEGGQGEGWLGEAIEDARRQTSELPAWAHGDEEAPDGK